MPVSAFHVLINLFALETMKVKARLKAFKNYSRSFFIQFELSYVYVRVRNMLIWLVQDFFKKNCQSENKYSDE